MTALSRREGTSVTYSCACRSLSRFCRDLFDRAQSLTSGGGEGWRWAPESRPGRRSRRRRSGEPFICSSRFASCLLCGAQDARDRHAICRRGSANSWGRDEVASPHGGLPQSQASRRTIAGQGRASQWWTAQMCQLRPLTHCTRAAGAVRRASGSAPRERAAIDNWVVRLIRCRCPKDRK
jgi:hypothetical protein